MPVCLQTVCKTETVYISRVAWRFLQEYKWTRMKSSWTNIMTRDHCSQLSGINIHFGNAEAHGLNWAWSSVQQKSQFVRTWKYFELQDAPYKHNYKAIAISFLVLNKLGPRDVMASLRSAMFGTSARTSPCRRRASESISISIYRHTRNALT